MLFYRGNKGRVAEGNQAAYGFARSEDGINWTRYGRNPVARASLFGFSQLYAPNMIVHDGIYYVFVELITGNNSEVFLASGVLPPEQD